MQFIRSEAKNLIHSLQSDIDTLYHFNRLLNKSEVAISDSDYGHGRLFVAFKYFVGYWILTELPGRSGARVALTFRCVQHGIRQPAYCNTCCSLFQNFKSLYFSGMQINTGKKIVPSQHRASTPKRIENTHSVILGQWQMNKLWQWCKKEALERAWVGPR